MMPLPWKERLNMLQINPHAATLADIARMATEAADGAWAEQRLAEIARKKNGERENMMQHTVPPDPTWAEQQLAEIVRMLIPEEEEDAVTHAMLIASIRKMIEAETDKYMALMKRVYPEAIPPGIK